MKSIFLSLSERGVAACKFPYAVRVYAPYTIIGAKALVLTVTL